MPVNAEGKLTVCAIDRLSRVLLPLALLLLLSSQTAALADSDTLVVAEGAKLLTAVLAREPAGEAASSFSTEIPKIYLQWQGQTLHAGDKVRCVWIAEDVGGAAPPDYHVDEAASIADSSQAAGTFVLSKPKKDWPEGKYRAEVYVGSELVATLPFTIEKLRGD